MGDALLGPGGGQVKVGQRGLLGVGGGDEDGVEGAALGAPGDGDVVSGGFAEAVQLFGGRGSGAGAWASASARGSPAARASSMQTSVISPARGISATRTAAGRWDINWSCSPRRPAHWVHAQLGAVASERTGVGVLWMVTS